MNYIIDRYADVILGYALRLRKGDVLSINTEEANSDIAHLIAKKAKALTGNGTYIQYIENGKVTEKEEAETDFPIGLSPTAMLHLPVFRNRERDNEIDTLPLRILQEYRHLAEPLDMRKAAVPFASAPVPSEDWDNISDERSLELISSLLFLEDDDFQKLLRKRDEEIIEECTYMNSLKLKGCHIFDENGTDISFSFLDGTEFVTGIYELADGRRFVPSVVSGEISRLIDSSSVNGVVSATKPFMFFSEPERHLTLSYKDGQLSDFSASFPFEWYLKQDENAGKVSELIMSDFIGFDSGFYAIPEWDRIRTFSLTLGGPKPDGILTEEALSKANDSIASITIPFGSSTTEIIATDTDGDEITIASDGFISSC